MNRSIIKYANNAISDLTKAINIDSTNSNLYQKRAATWSNLFKTMSLEQRSAKAISDYEVHLARSQNFGAYQGLLNILQKPEHKELVISRLISSHPKTSLRTEII